MFSPNRLYCAKNGTLNYLSRSSNTWRSDILAAIYCHGHGNHHNNRLKIDDFRDHCNRLNSIASAYSNPWDNITEIHYLNWEQFDYYNQKQSLNC